MNPFFKILDNIFGGINKLINNLNKGTRDAIRAGFFFLIFVLTVIGGIIGYRSGMQNAKIKSSPLFEITNQTFQIDINREHRDGNFSRLLDSALINEAKTREPDKLSYPSRESMLPEYDKALAEPAATAKYKASPGTYQNESPLESDYRGNADIKGPSSVKPLDKTIEPVEPESSGTGLLQKTSPLPETNSEAPVPMEEKKGVQRPENKRTTPSMIDKDSGVIE